MLTETYAAIRETPPLDSYIVAARKAARRPLSIREIWEDIVLRQHFVFTTKEQISMAGPSRTLLRITGLHADVYDDVERMAKNNVIRMIRPKDTGMKRGKTLVDLM
jgi:hypothetical protein